MTPTSDPRGPDCPASHCRVVMLVKNSFEYDARVRKEAESLARVGYRVTVIAIHVPGVTAKEEILPSGVHVRRVPRLYGALGRLTGASTVTPGSSGAPETSAPSRAGSGDDAGTTRRSRGARIASLGKRLVRRVLKLAGPAARTANTWWLNRQMRLAAVAKQPAVVHAHDLNTLHPAAQAAKVAGAKLVYDAHELHRHRHNLGRLAQLRARIDERRLVRCVDLFITAGNAWADYLAGLYRIPRPVVLRNVPEPATPAEGWDLRTELGISAEQRVLLYQGSIQTNRGIEEAIGALAHLDRCVLVVAGYGAHRPALERLAARAGVADRVYFFGPVPNHELLHWTASADVGLCGIRNSSLSYYWSLPNKLFEYVMAGIPVVASDFPEMGALVRETGVGEVCDPDDPASIAAAVRRILDDPDRAAACRRNAAQAANIHNWSHEEQVLLDAYTRLQPEPSATA